MNEIELYSKINDPMDACTKLGQFFARSGMFGCQRDEQGAVLALACLSERKSPIDILRQYHLIDGKLCDRADGMLAKCRGRGGKHKVIKRTDQEASIELTYDGQTHVFSFTWEEAQTEPFPFQKDGKTFKKNWATPRARMQMLWARVVSDAVRTLAPEIVAGVYTPEEAGEDVEVKPLLPPQTITVNAVPVDQGPPKPKPETADTEYNGPDRIPPSEETPKPEPKPVEDTSNPDLNPIPTDPVEIERAIREVIGTSEVDITKAIKWCVAKKWLRDDMQSFGDLPPKRVKMILEKPEAARKAMLG